MTDADAPRMQRVVMLDDDGQEVTAGDSIVFSYGIPPRRVHAALIQRDENLFALCPGHNPPECLLYSLRDYVGAWFKHNAR